MHYPRKNATQIRLTNKWGVTRFPPWMRNGDLFSSHFVIYFFIPLGLSAEIFALSVCFIQPTAILYIFNLFPNSEYKKS